MCHIRGQSDPIWGKVWHPWDTWLWVQLLATMAGRQSAVVDVIRLRLKPNKQIWQAVSGLLHWAPCVNEACTGLLVSCSSRWCCCRTSWNSRCCVSISIMTFSWFENSFYWHWLAGVKSHRARDPAEAEVTQLCRELRTHLPEIRDREVRSVRWWKYRYWEKDAVG